MERWPVAASARTSGRAVAPARRRAPSRGVPGAAEDAGRVVQWPVQPARRRPATTAPATINAIGWAPSTPAAMPPTATIASSRRCRAAARESGGGRPTARRRNGQAKPIGPSSMINGCTGSRSAIAVPGPGQLGLIGARRSDRSSRHSAVRSARRTPRHQISSQRSRHRTAQAPSASSTPYAARMSPT